MSIESLEHYFGCACTWNSEFNTLDFTRFVKKLDKILEEIFCSKLTSRCGYFEGYQSGFNGFLRTNIKILRTRYGDGNAESLLQFSIDVNYDRGPAVFQQQDKALSIINATSDYIVCLFRRIETTKICPLQSACN